MSTFPKNYHKVSMSRDAFNIIKKAKLVTKTTISKTIEELYNFWMKENAKQTNIGVEKRK